MFTYYDGLADQSGFHLTVERDWFWFWFWFYYALWLASVFTLVLVLRQSSENRSNTGLIGLERYQDMIDMVTQNETVVIYYGYDNLAIIYWQFFETPRIWFTHLDNQNRLYFPNCAIDSLEIFCLCVCRCLLVNHRAVILRSSLVLSAPSSVSSEKP